MTATGKSRKEIAALEAEHQRLRAVWDVLHDMSDAAREVEKAKGFTNQFEQDRRTYAVDAMGPVSSESRAALDRVLIAEHGEARAAQMWAEAEAATKRRLEQLRKRSAARDGRRSR